jgi:hypothetical protein
LASTAGHYRSHPIAPPGSRHSSVALRDWRADSSPRGRPALISGHKTESVYRRYDIVSQQDMKLAAAKMEHYLEGLKSQPITTKITTVEEKPN